MKNTQSASAIAKIFALLLCIVLLPVAVGAAAVASSTAPTVSPTSVQSAPDAFKQMTWNLQTYGVYPITVINLTPDPMWINSSSSSSAYYKSYGLPFAISLAGAQAYGYNGDNVLDPIYPTNPNASSCSPFVSLNSSTVAKGGFTNGINQNMDFVNPFLWFPSWDSGTSFFGNSEWINTFGAGQNMGSEMLSAANSRDGSVVVENVTYNTLNTSGQTALALDMSDSTQYSTLTFQTLDNGTVNWKNAIRLYNGGLATSGYQASLAPAPANGWEIFKDCLSLGTALLNDALDIAEPMEGGGDVFVVSQDLIDTANSVTALTELGGGGGNVPQITAPYPGTSNAFHIGFQTMENMPAKIPANNGFVYCSMVLPISKVQGSSGTDAQYGTKPDNSDVFLSENQVNTSGALNAGTAVTRNQYTVNSGDVQQAYSGKSYTMAANLFAVFNFSGIGNGLAQQTIGSTDQMYVMILNEGVFDAYSWFKYRQQQLGASNDKTFFAVNYPKLVKYFRWIDAKHPLDASQIISLIGIESTLAKNFKTVNLAQQSNSMATISSLLSRYYLEYCTANGINPNDKTTGLGMIFADTVGNNSEGKTPNQPASSASATSAPNGTQIATIQPIVFN